MLRFKQFLMREAFYKGTDGKYGYTEIWKNPTRSELRDIADTGDQMAAYVVGKNLFVWNRDNGNHSDILPVLPRAADGLPLYLYMDHKTGSVDVTTSSFSMYSKGEFKWDEDAIINKLKPHPAFKVFSGVKKG